MHRILPITILTLRSILREKVALCMLALLTGVLFLLPSGLEGDGTLSGDVRMYIRYTLGFSALLMAGMTLWVSCASIATDLSNRRLHMVLTKPVSRWQLWWGKWLAVTLLISVLMALSGAVTLWRVHQRVGEANLSEEEARFIKQTLITARTPVDVPQNDFREEAIQEVKARLESGWLPPAQMTEEEVILQAVLYLRTLEFSARVGQEASWTFELPQAVQEGEPLQLGLDFDGTSMGMTSLKGTWRLGTPDSPDLAVIPITGSPSGTEVYPFNLTGEFEGASTIVARFTLDGEDARMVFFKPGTGVRLYRPGGAFAPNLFRAVILYTGLLSLLAALGVATSGMFSLPVACYVTAVFLFMQAFSGVVSEVIDLESAALTREDMPVIERFLRQARVTAFKGIQLALRPLRLGQPLERVASGERIAPGEVAGTLSLRFLPLLSMTALVGGGLFLRREIGGAV